jgi:hypothetical protein
MQPKYTYEQLIEKLVRAKVKLEGTRRSHTDRCAVELDPEGFAPCSCGVSAHNSALEAALKELKL